MTEIKKDPKWKKGDPSPNPAGSGKKRKRIRKSELRNLERSLRAMEPKALENMEKSINGEQMDKLVLESSKWLITSVISVNKACAADEISWQRLQQGLKELDKMDEESEDDKEQSPESIESELPKRLSLVYTAPESDEE